MKYYGMDIHKRYSGYTVVDEAGNVLEQGRVANQPQALAEVMHPDGPAKVVMEATCNWYYLYDLLEGMVDEVCLAHPLCTKAIGFGLRASARRLPELLPIAVFVQTALCSNRRRPPVRGHQARRLLCRAVRINRPATFEQVGRTAAGY